MRAFFALMILAVSTSFASAAALSGDVVLAQSNIETFNPATFTAGPNVDVFHIVVANPNAADATSLEFNIAAALENFNAGAALTFKAGTDLPVLGPNTVAESFFVLPDGSVAGDVLGANTTDEAGVLTSSYTLPGTTSFVDAGGSATLAVLSVIAGSTTAKDIADGIVARAAVGGVFEEIQFIPEPTTAILAMLGLVGVATRRRS